MATFKCIEATPAIVREMQVAMSDMDAHVQEADERIEAMAKAMALMIALEPQTEYGRDLLSLCEMIRDTSSSAMNEVNARAEVYHANWMREEVARV